MIWAGRRDHLVGDMTHLVVIPSLLVGETSGSLEWYSIPRPSVNVMLQKYRKRSKRTWVPKELRGKLKNHDRLMHPHRWALLSLKMENMCLDKTFTRWEGCTRNDSSGISSSSFPLGYTTLFRSVVTSCRHTTTETTNSDALVLKHHSAPHFSLLLNICSRGNLLASLNYSIIFPYSFLLCTPNISWFGEHLLRCNHIAEPYFLWRWKICA